MDENNKILQIISNETITEVSHLDIVTPTIYKTFFNKYAYEHNKTLDDEEKITDLILNKKILECKNFQKQNSSNAVKLSDNTSRAISAIKEKDEDKLNEVLKETQELRREIEKLKESVYRDELTRAYNRKWLNDHYLVEDSEIMAEDGILAIIDLNYFKEINDRFGHIIGDKVLIFITNELKKVKVNVVRYGGDEFILIFPSIVAVNIVKEQLNKVREDILSKKLKAESAFFRVSFSFGIKEFQKEDLFSSIVEEADKNMYEDKTEIKKTLTSLQTHMPSD